MKFTPSRSRTSGFDLGSVLDEAAHALLERFGGREEEAAVEAQHRDAGECLVVGVLDEIAEDMRAGLATEQRDARPRGDIDEPEEREHDADDDPGEHAGRQDADEGCDRDPEVESRDAVQAA